MTVILIDARYLGNALRRGRRSANITCQELSQILHIPRNDIAKYEHGRAVIPEDTLYHILSHGMLMLKARKFNSRK